MILGRKRKITVKVINQLLDEGANLPTGNDFVAHWTSVNDHLRVVKLILSREAKNYKNMQIKQKKNKIYDSLH